MIFSTTDITKFVNIIDYFNNLNVNFHTSLVQYPKSLNIKLLSPKLKQKVTKEFKLWLLSNKHIDNEKYKRIEKFGSNVINYMNAEDWHHEWQSFLDYSFILDKHHSTNLFEIYPEYDKK